MSCSSQEVKRVSFEVKENELVLKIKPNPRSKCEIMDLRFKNLQKDVFERF